MSWPSWKDFSRVFEDPYSTFWWFGERYHKKFGNKWPYEGQEPPEGYVYPTREGFETALLCAVLISILRFAVERLIGGPIGQWFGVKSHAQGTPAGENAVLETMMKSVRYKRPSEAKIEEAAQVTGLAVRTVEIWVRRRQREVMPSKLTKFKESFWRLCFYTFVFCYGLTILWGEDFFWETKLCWVGYPEHIWGIKKSIYYYYLLESAFYMSLMISQFLDTKRKDFWEMFIHHIATLTLIALSYFGGAARLGALVMVTHDFADIFLEFAKCCIYAGRKPLANVGFALFTAGFFVSRLVLYPFRLLWVTCQTVPKYWPAVYIYGTCVFSLQGLHIFWFGIILRMAIRSVYEGADVSKDDRSDDELSTTGDELEEKKKKVQ